jgi:serine/threonine protein kinase
MVFQPGTHILQDRYRIEAEIDHGSFGVVYRATYLKLNSPRAIKVLRRDMPGIDNVAIAHSRERFNT